MAKPWTKPWTSPKTHRLGFLTFSYSCFPGVIFFETFDGGCLLVSAFDTETFWCGGCVLSSLFSEFGFWLGEAFNWFASNSSHPSFVSGQALWNSCLSEGFLLIRNYYSNEKAVTLSVWPALQQDLLLLDLVFLFLWHLTQLHCSNMMILLNIPIKIAFTYRLLSSDCELVRRRWLDGGWCPKEAPKTMKSLWRYYINHNQFNINWVKFGILWYRNPT